MLWSHIVSIATTGYAIPGGTTPAEFLSQSQSFGNAYGPGNASRSLQGSVPNIPHNTPISVFDTGAPVPGGATRLISFAEDPQLYAVYGDRVRPFGDPSDYDAVGLRAILTGPGRYIPAGEPIAAFDFVEGGPAALRGVHVDASAVLDAVYEVSAADGSFVQGASIIKQGDPPALNGSEGAVLSAGARSAFVVGGTADGTPSGVPNALLWTLHVDDGTWSSVAASDAEISGDDPPGKVLGTTYALGEDAVYFIDVVTRPGPFHFFSKTTVRLRRFQPADAVLETVAVLPESWADAGLTQSWLVTSATTGLVFGASTPASGPHQRSLVAAFTQDSISGDWSYAGSVLEPYAMVAPPLAWDDHVTVFKPAAGDAAVVSEVIPLSKLFRLPSIPCHTGHGFGHGGHGFWP
jgi:hypothetical protein